MPQAVWNGKILAESDACVIVENNHYFPPDSLHREYFKHGDTHTFCPWKGKASYYDVIVDGEVNRDAAWYYSSPKDEAAHIQNYVAFWNGVEITGT